MSANFAIQYVQPDGRLTSEGLRLFAGLFERVAVLEAKLAAVAAVAAPVGGATIDAEARAAIVALIG